VVGFILCCLSCCVVVGLGYVVRCIGFRCHIIHAMFPGVGGTTEVGRYES
jgi:hypothetical protein